MSDDVDFNALAMEMLMLAHADDMAEFVVRASKMTKPEIAAVAVVLALWVDEAWGVLCARDGVPFEEFTATAGAWLARGGR